MVHYLRASNDHRLLDMVPSSSLVISQGWGLIDLPLRAAFSPAHPLAQRDVPLARAWAFQSSSSLVKGVVMRRASNEHSFTVGVLQARRAPGRSHPPRSVCADWNQFMKVRRTRASFRRGPGGIEDGWSLESVRVMPFYCGKRSASICVVHGPRKSSTYSSECASGFFEPAAPHLSAAPLPRNEGLLGQTPSAIALLW